MMMGALLAPHATSSDSKPAAARLAAGCLLLVLGASLTHCRFDKLINPAIADRLAVSADSLRASANAGSSTVRVTAVLLTSADGATLAWSATKTASWMTLEPTAGTAPDTLTVRLSPESLLQAVHRDTIVFTSSEAPYDTVRLPVTFDILAAAPELAVSPPLRDTTALAGSALPDTFSLRIKNTGGLLLNWTAALDTTWVTLSDSSGALAPQESTLVTVTLRADSLAAGTHRGSITITDPTAIGSPDTLPITFRIAPCAEPSLTLDALETSSLTLGDCGAPARPGSQAKLFAVQATAGDTLTLRLAAAFNAYMILKSSSGTVLTESDDCPAAGTACITGFIVPATGRYIIEATSAARDTGAFTLSVVRERAPLAPLPGQFRSDSATAIATGGETPENVVVFKATLNDPNLRDSVRLELERTPLTGGTVAAASPWVSPGAAAAIRVAGLVENEGYYWRVRTCDQTGRCSGWVHYGTNSDPAADFFINAVQEAPAAPTLLSQKLPNGNTIPVGDPAGAGSATVVFAGMVSDPDPGAVIRIQVEVKPTNAAMDESGLAAGSVGVATNGTATVSLTLSGTIILGTNYYWRAQACDQTSRCGPWVHFGNNGTQTDFRVDGL